MYVEIRMDDKVRSRLCNGNGLINGNTHMNRVEI